MYITIMLLEEFNKLNIKRQNISEMKVAFRRRFVIIDLKKHSANLSKALAMD